MLHSVLIALICRLLFVVSRLNFFWIWDRTAYLNRSILDPMDLVLGSYFGCRTAFRSVLQFNILVPEPKRFSRRNKLRNN